MRDSYRVEWLEPAKQDLRDIVFYLIDKAPLVAIGIQEEFDSQLSVLEKFPHISQENDYFDGVLFRFQFDSETRRRQASDEDSAKSTARSERGSQHSITDEMESELDFKIKGITLRCGL